MMFPVIQSGGKLGEDSCDHLVQEGSMTFDRKFAPCVLDIEQLIY